MLEIIQENKLRRQRYQLRSQEVKLLEQKLEWESKEKEAQLELQKYERARKIRNDYMERQENARKIRSNQEEDNQVHDYLAEEPLFQKMERMRVLLEKKKAKKLEKELQQKQKPAIDFKKIRREALDLMQEKVVKSKPELERPDWHPPVASKFHKEVWMRELDKRKQEEAKFELQRLLIEKSQKFSTFIRKYLKPKQMKDPKPLFKKQEPRQKIKFSPSFPLLKAKDVIQQSQLKSVKSQIDVLQSVKSKADVLQSVNSQVDVLQSVKNQADFLRAGEESLLRVASSIASNKESKTLSEIKHTSKPREAKHWTTHIESGDLSPEKKYEYVHSAAKTLEQKALRAEAKIKQDTIKSNRSHHSFSRSPRLQVTSSVRVLPLPQTTNYYKQLNGQINEIEMTDTLLVDAIKAKMALLALELSK